MREKHKSPETEHLDSLEYLAFKTVASDLFDLIKRIGLTSMTQELSVIAITDEADFHERNICC